MQIFLSTLLQKLTSRIRSLLPQRSSAETSEPRAVSDMDEIISQNGEDVTYENISREGEDVTEKITDSEEIEATELTNETILDSDIKELREKFGELSDIEDITSLPNPTRYGALRDLGLTPTEAYLATRPISKSATTSHLKSSVPRVAQPPLGSMTKQELSQARGLFSDMDDTEIQRLYKRVTN